jgi:hypothetical protein
MISLRFCMQYLMNGQGNGSSYTKLRLFLCEGHAKLYQDTIQLIKRLLYEILIK